MPCLQGGASQSTPRFMVSALLAKAPYRGDDLLPGPNREQCSRKETAPDPENHEAEEERMFPLASL